MTANDQLMDANCDLFSSPTDFEPLIEADEVIAQVRLAASQVGAALDAATAVPLLVPPAYYSLARGIEDNRRINDALIHSAKRMQGFAAGAAEPKFGDAAIEELRRIRSAGAVGVVFSPRAQGLFGDDWQMVRMGKAAADCGLLNMIRSAPCSANESLPRIWSLARSCPEARFLVLGAFASWENIQVTRMSNGGPDNVWYDLSGLSEAHDLASLIADIGASRLVFGSGNWPSNSTIFDLVTHVDVAQADRAAILFGNAASLIGLSREARNP